MAKVLPTPKAPPTRPTRPDSVVTGQVIEYTKIFFYRNYKFIKDEEDEKEICEAMWKRLHKVYGWESEAYNLDLESFRKIYASVIKSSLSAQRQYSQTKGKHSAMGKYFCWLLDFTHNFCCLYA